MAEWQKNGRKIGKPRYYIFPSFPHCLTGKSKVEIWHFPHLFAIALGEAIWFQNLIINSKDTSGEIISSDGSDLWSWSRRYFHFDDPLSILNSAYFYKQVQNLTQIMLLKMFLISINSITPFLVIDTPLLLWSRISKSAVKNTTLPYLIGWSLGHLTSLSSCVVKQLNQPLIAWF